MKLSTIGLFITVFCFGLPAFPSGTVLNGGDVIECSTHPRHDFPKVSGYYSLDYILTYDEAASPIVETNSLKQSLQRINSLMKEKLPELAGSFEIFARNFLNRDLKRSHLWQPSHFGLINVEDENMLAQLPETCRNGSRKASLIQAVVRQLPGYSRMPQHMVFAYDKEVLKNMDDRTPVQLSFLLVHEFLWEFSQHVVTNRTVNRFFHSKDFERKSRQEILDYFKQISFLVPDNARAIVYPESCEADPNAVSIGAFDSNAVTKVAAGGVELYCNDKECQYNPYASTKWFDTAFGQYNPQFVFSEGNRFQLKITHGPKTQDALDCRVDLRTAEVSCSRLMAGSDWSESEYKGTMGENCLRVSEDRLSSSATGVSRRMRVLYFKLNGQESMRRSRR